MSTETIEHLFNVEKPARLKVSNVRGHVDIRPGDDGIIHITAVKHNSSSNNEKNQIIIGQESDGLVVAEAKYENSVTNWFGLNKPCRVDFTIRVPEACSVKLNCVSSSAAIQGLEGDFNFQGVSGKLELSNLKGAFDIGSVSGKLNAEQLVGPIDVNNVSGKVHISDSQIPTLVGKSVSGSAIIETPLTDGPYEFKSVSGNLSMISPEDTECTIYMKSVSGKAKVNLPVTSRSGARNKQVIQVAGGGPEVMMKSVSGILKIGSPDYQNAKTESVQEENKITEPVEDNENIPAETAPPSKSSMEILQEIEKGQISVDEALKQMNL